MPKATARVDVHPLDDPLRAQWCGRCFLPSVVVQHWVMVLDGHPFEVYRARVCDTCGSGAP